MKEPQYEHCYLCDELTSKAGAADDSVYCDECGAGPFCDECFVGHECEPSE
jgi:hypothetical protein